MRYNEPSPLEVRIISQRFDLPNSASMDTYLANEGYVAIKKAIEMTPEAIIEELKASALRGRGGAGFPTGMKWSFVPRNTGKPTFIICNSDESEPGTCKDRLLMENDPHQMIEGMLIAGWTIKSNKGYVFIRGEYRYLIDIVDRAIDEAYARGYLGKNILGSGWDFDLYTHTGAGAYECGEESALLESLEGKRGIPRLKPPFPAVVGAFQSPTILNNCETFSAVPVIFRNGGAWFAELGTPKNGGTRLTCVSGHVNKPGVYELPMGFPIMRLINEVCGGIRNGKKLKAVIPGGSSSPVLRADECDIPYDFDSLAKAKTMAGSGGLVILDEDTDIVAVALRTIKFYAHESCGWCIPCREGTTWLKKILTRFHEGGGVEADIDLIGELADNMLGRTFCALGDAAAMPTTGFITKFRGEFEEYLRKSNASASGAVKSNLTMLNTAPAFQQAGSEISMPDPVKFTIDGHQLEAPAGTLLINAAKEAGISIPAFCYYDNLSLQAACRMCLVEVEKTPKLQVACTLPVAEGMVVHTDSPQVQKARKGTLEFLLTNHPLDCPVCDKGGECELQDMVFRYGAGESRFRETKIHVEEKQWSPVVFYDAPRCILCYRCVRICGEGLGVNALGIGNRGSAAEIVPNRGDHLECDECGACIDICPVGALTSGTYRYKTRPWEMEHVGTVCTHCSNGCKTTLGVRNGEIVRANNRDRSGLNGEFLCIKGRYAFDFNAHPDRLTAPLVRTDGTLKPVSWAIALATVANKFTTLKAKRAKFGVIGSNHTTNEENYLLQKFARSVLGTSNIDHHRTGDVATLIDALHGHSSALATTEDLFKTKAALVIASDLAQEQPFIAYQLRSNWRLNKAHVYAVTPGPVREDNYATAARAEAGKELGVLEGWRDQLAKEPELLILFGSAIKGEAIRQLVSFGDSLGIPVKYVCLVDYSNSRGASDMGVLPDLLPGYRPVSDSGLGAGLNYDQILADPNLEALWVIGSNPLARQELASKGAFVVVQDLFLTETARRADVVLPAASAYEKNGTVTNVCGDVQKLSRGPKTMGAKSDLEILGLLAREMRVDLGTPKPDAIFAEIRQAVHGYDLPLGVVETGGAAPTAPVNGRVAFEAHPELIRPTGNTLFTSGTLGRYSKMLNSVIEGPGALYNDPHLETITKPGSVQTETVSRNE